MPPQTNEGEENIIAEKFSRKLHRNPFQRGIKLETRV